MRFRVQGFELLSEIMRDTEYLMLLGVRRISKSKRFLFQSLFAVFSQQKDPQRVARFGVQRPRKLGSRLQESGIQDSGFRLAEAFYSRPVQTTHGP